VHKQLNVKEGDGCRYDSVPEKPRETLENRIVAVNIFCIDPFGFDLCGRKFIV
jgi:hypothetical protein